MLFRRIGRRFSPIRCRKLSNAKVRKPVKIGHRIVQIGPQFCTSRNPILSYFYDKVDEEDQYRKNFGAGSRFTPL